MEREKKRYEMEFYDGAYHIINPWNGCSIYSCGSKEKVERVLAEHNGEEYKPEF